MRAASPITQSDAVDMMENMLTGLSSGDFATWTRDWSDALRGEISESDFDDFSDLMIESAGTIDDITDVSLASDATPGRVRWQGTAHFEDGEASFWIEVGEDSGQIEEFFLRRPH